MSTTNDMARAMFLEEHCGARFGNLEAFERTWAQSDDKLKECYVRRASRLLALLDGIEASYDQSHD